MCGISAWIESDPIDIDNFKAFNNIVSHRGPDASQVRTYSIAERYIAFGHRRLSIIDLAETANQPLSRNNYSIIFNGEIYNYIELRTELKNKGVIFQTSSDTEVLLAGYITWGKDFLHKLNGMFAFIILDCNNGVLFFARDRFGVKPLYYYKNDLGVYFASEIKQFSKVKGFSPIGNVNTICNFVKNRYLDYNHETLFKDVFQLKGGEAGTLRLQDMKLSTYRWYDLAASKPRKNKTFFKLFGDSVDLRLRSDVEVGSCLSGGIDSNSIVFFADSRLRGQKKSYTLQTFTSCFDESKYDERELVKITQDKTSIKSHYVFPKKDKFYSDLKNLIWFQDGPVWSSSMYAQSCIFEAAKAKGVSVMLDGQGADEIFCGYTSIFYPAYFRALNFKEKFYELLSSKNRLYTIRVWVRNLIGERETCSPSVFVSKFDDQYQKKFASLNECVLHMVNFHLPALLHFEDRNSMRYSIEARLPFLDYKLVEYGFHSDPSERIGSATSKKVVRAAIAKIVPKEITENPIKKGFGTPQRSWLLNNKLIVRDAINNLTKVKIFDKISLELILADFMNDNCDEGLIMRLFTLAIWFEVFDIKELG